MRRRKVAETLKKTDPKLGFRFSDHSSSRADSDSKRRRRVTFEDVDHRSSPLNESQAGPSVDAKTSEFAFFKKVKSDFGLSSKSSNSNNVEQNPKTSDSRDKPGEYAETDREAKDKCKSYSFSTPIHNARRGSCASGINLTRKDIEKDLGKSSAGCSRDKDTVRSNNNLRSEGISDEKGDIFSVKRKKLRQWVKDTWEIPELTPIGPDLVPLLLTRLFPGTEEDTPPSRYPKLRTDKVKRRTCLDSPVSSFLKMSHESYTEVDRSLQMERDRSITGRGWLENGIAPSLEFASDRVHSFIPRDPEEMNFSISYPKGSVYRPPLLKQKASLSFPVEDTLECSSISRLHHRNYKPLSLGYYREESGYRSEDVMHDHRDSIREPSAALRLEWNTATASTRKTDDLPLSYDTKLITYPNASSSYLTDDNPWSSDYSSSHDLVARDQLYPLPVLSRYTSDSFLLPTTDPTNQFEHDLERHIIDDDDVVAADQNVQIFHRTDSSDCLSRDYAYYHNLPHSPVEHCSFKVLGCEKASFPFSSISNSNLLEASSPTRSDRFKSHDWIPFQFQSPQAWNDSCIGYELKAATEELF